MKIQRDQIDTIRGMYTCELETVLKSEIVQWDPESNFIKCVQYELGARRRCVQCDCDDCYRADGWVIVE